jgi:hypothetical protein
MGCPFNSDCAWTGWENKVENSAKAQIDRRLDFNWGIFKVQYFNGKHLFTLK